MHHRKGCAAYADANFASLKATRCPSSFLQFDFRLSDLVCSIKLVSLARKYMECLGASLLPQNSQTLARESTADMDMSSQFLRAQTSQTNAVLSGMGSKAE